MAKHSTYTCDACKKSVTCQDGDRLVLLRWQTGYAVPEGADLRHSDSRAKEVCYSCLDKMLTAIESNHWERIPKLEKTEREAAEKAT